MSQINIEEEISILMKEGWSKEQAILRTNISLELRKGKGDLSNPEYENRFREKMHKHRR